MIDGELGFEAVLSDAAFSGDDPCVVDQDVQGGVLDLEVCGEVAD